MPFIGISPGLLILSYGSLTVKSIMYQMREEQG